MTCSDHDLIVRIDEKTLFLLDMIVEIKDSIDKDETRITALESAKNKFTGMIIVIPAVISLLLN